MATSFEVCTALARFHGQFWKGTRDWVCVLSGFKSPCPNPTLGAGTLKFYTRWTHLNTSHYAPGRIWRCTCEVWRKFGVLGFSTIFATHAKVTPATNPILAAHISCNDQISTPPSHKYLICLISPRKFTNY